MSPDQRLAVSNVVVAAELPLRFRQIKAGMIVAEDPQMRELDSAAYRHLTTMLDKLFKSINEVISKYFYSLIMIMVATIGKKEP